MSPYFHVVLTSHPTSLSFSWVVTQVSQVSSQCAAHWWSCLPLDPASVINPAWFMIFQNQCCTELNAIGTALWFKLLLQPCYFAALGNRKIQQLHPAAQVWRALWPQRLMSSIRGRAARLSPRCSFLHLIMKTNHSKRVSLQSFEVHVVSRVCVTSCLIHSIHHSAVSHHPSLYAHFLVVFFLHQSGPRKHQGHFPCSNSESYYFFLKGVVLPWGPLQQH